MGASLQKMWHEMGEVEEAGKEREVKEKEGMKKIKLKDRLRTRILRGDPRSATEDVSRTPIAVEKSGGDGSNDTPLKTIVQDPRSPGFQGAVDRTPIVVLAPKEDTATPQRGCVPPAFELPPITPQCDTPELSDPRSPAVVTPRTPISTSTPATIPFGVKDQTQPCNLLAEKLRVEALALLRENQVSSQTAPSAEASQDGGHNDSSLLI